MGHTFRVEGDKPDSRIAIYQIVGLVRNTKYYELREDFIPIAFLPIAQDETPGTGGTWVVRTSGRPQEAFHALKETVAAVNPSFVLEFKVMTEQIAESLQRDRLMAVLAGAFGVLAGVLAAIGLYGVIAYMVARRQNEIGVRMALGADRASVIRLVLREAMMLLAAGLVIGIGLALWAGQAAAKLLFGLKAERCGDLRGCFGAAGRGRGSRGICSGAAGVDDGPDGRFAGGVKARASSETRRGTQECVRHGR